MFDAAFYQIVLPDKVNKECARQPGNTPVVLLRLGDGRVLDACHIVQAGEPWLAVLHYRDTRTCEEMDMEFLPYTLVSSITVEMHSPDKRPIGFQSPSATPISHGP